MHDRRRLVGAVAHREHPGQVQLSHIVSSDLIEWAVTVAIERPPPREPVGVRWPLQECVRHRGQAGGLSAAKSDRAAPWLRRLSFGRRSRLDRRGCGRTIRLQDESDDVPIGRVTEIPTLARRHLAPDVLEQVIRAATAPHAAEADTGQRRSMDASLQPGSVTLGTRVLVHRLPGHRLRGRRGGDTGSQEKKPSNEPTSAREHPGYPRLVEPFSVTAPHVSPPLAMRRHLVSTIERIYTLKRPDHDQARGSGRPKGLFYDDR